MKPRELVVYLQLLFFLSARTRARLFQGSVPPAPEPWYGDHIGSLSDIERIGIAGEVFVVNSSCLQILNFSYPGGVPDIFFWLEPSASYLTSQGIIVPTFEYGLAPLGAYKDARVVLSISDDRDLIKEFRSFGLWSKRAFSSLSIPEGLVPPKSEYLEGVFDGTRYSTGSGPVLIIDRRTVKVFGFTYDGTRGPDGYFFVGRGHEPKRRDGVKVPIRYRDSPNFVTALNEFYTGDRDIILDLPEGFDIYNIDYISIFCYKYGNDFGHIKITNLSSRIPPFVPEQKRMADMEDRSMSSKPWEPIILVANHNRSQLTFQLGPPGGKRGYEAIAGSRPGRFVWYVNGFMAPELWMLRGQTYTFIVQGGNDATNESLNNPLYISNDPTGGYKKLSAEERSQVQLYAGVRDLRPLNEPNAASTGKLCAWLPRPEVNPDSLDEFMQYKKTLKLSCQNGPTGRFQWRPDAKTPDQLFYQSFTNYNMGGKIMIVDEIPQDIPDVREEPYDYDEYLRYQVLQQQMQKNGRAQQVQPSRKPSTAANVDWDALNESSSASCQLFSFFVLLLCILSLFLR